MSAPPSWTVIEDALATWAAAGTGLPVVWGQQKPGRPAVAYVGLRVTSIAKIGQDWRATADAVAPAAGAELDVFVRGARQVELSVQAFAGPDGAGIGVSGAAMLLDRMILTAAPGSPRRVALNAAGVGLGACSPVQSIDGFLGAAVFEPRAAFTARLFIAAELADTATYIGSSEVTNQIDDRLIEAP